MKYVIFQEIKADLLLVLSCFRLLSEIDILILLLFLGKINK